MKYNNKVVLLALVLSIVFLAGCGTKAKHKLTVYWPPPPNDPKMEWITTFRTVDDFEKTESEKSRDKFLGTNAGLLFGKPVFAASRGDGVVYVSDLDGGSIRAVDFNKRTTEVLDLPVSSPVGLAFDSGGSFFVADSFNQQVYQFSPQFEPVRNFGHGDLKKPTFIALDESRRRLYVSDVVARTVFAFDLDSGEKLFAFEGRLEDGSGLYMPQGLAIDKQGRVFVADQLNSRIQAFDTEGKSLYVFGERTDQPTDFEGPRGLAFDSEDNLFVADVRKGRLLVFTPEGTPLTTLGSSDAFHPLGFRMPSGVSVDPNDRIYIADGMTRRITIWQMLTPSYLAEHPLDEDSIKIIERKALLLEEEKKKQ